MEHLVLQAIARLRAQPLRKSRQFLFEQSPCRPCLTGRDFTALTDKRATGVHDPACRATPPIRSSRWRSAPPSTGPASDRALPACADRVPASARPASTWATRLNPRSLEAPAFKPNRGRRERRLNHASRRCDKPSASRSSRWPCGCSTGCASASASSPSHWPTSRPEIDVRWTPAPSSASVDVVVARRRARRRRPTLTS